jgi:hypothetical protein
MMITEVIVSLINPGEEPLIDGCAHYCIAMKNHTLKSENIRWNPKTQSVCLIHLFQLLPPPLNIEAIKCEFSELLKWIVDDWSRIWNYEFPL